MHFCGIVWQLNRFGDGVVQVFNIKVFLNRHTHDQVSVTAQSLYHDILESSTIQCLNYLSRLNRLFIVQFSRYTTSEVQTEVQAFGDNKEDAGNSQQNREDCGRFGNLHEWNDF